MKSPSLKEVIRTVRPLLSSNKTEAKRRVRKLYKSWCREIEHMNVEYQLPLSYDEAVKKIKSEFLKHKDITDVRVIDMLILKSENELYDISKRIRFVCQFYYHFNADSTSDSTESNEFMSKFLSGKD